jgi:hypothetical protein
VGEGLLRVVFRKALYSRAFIVWLTLAVRTRAVVIVPTPVILVVVIVVVVVVVVVVVALATNGVILGVHLVLFVGP